MSRPHRYTSRDSNQSKIVDVLRQVGYTVCDVSTVSDEQCPGDILVYAYKRQCYGKVWQLFEIKTPAGKANEEQRVNAASGMVPIARRAEDVIGWFQGD